MTMDTTRREMMFMVGAAGAVVATSVTLRRATMVVRPETIMVAETSVTLRVPVDVMESMGLCMPTPHPEGYDEDTFVNNKGWYRDVRFHVVGLDHVEDPDERAMLQNLSRHARAYPGVTVPRTLIQAAGKRITDVNYDIRERAAYVTYRLWAAPVAVMMVEFNDAVGLEMDVFYHTQEIIPGDFKDPFAKAQ